MSPAIGFPWGELSTLVPNTITVYMSKAQYESPQPQGVGTQAPVDNTKPYKPWRDNSAHYPGGAWWQGGAGPKLYTTLAVDSAGELTKTPIGSPEFLATYSSTVIRVYQEYRHLFPEGVPYLVTLEMPKDQAAAFNYGFNGQFIPPPAQIQTNQMLATHPTGGWAVIGYEDWLRIQRQAATMSDDQKVSAVVAIGLRQGQPSRDKVSEMLTVLRNGLPPVGPVV